MELNPFNYLAFDPPLDFLLLKATVTSSPPKLTTSEWLVLFSTGCGYIEQSAGDEENPHRLKFTSRTYAIATT